MSDDSNIDFSKARAEVDQTMKSLDLLTASVEKLNRVRLTDAKAALASLEAKGAIGIEASITKTFSDLNKLEDMLLKSGDKVKKINEKNAKELLASVTLSFNQIEAAVVTHLTGVNALHRRAEETKLSAQEAANAKTVRAQEKLADIQLKADRAFTAASIAEAERRNLRSSQVIKDHLEIQARVATGYATDMAQLRAHYKAQETEAAAHAKRMASAKLANIGLTGVKLGGAEVLGPYSAYNALKVSPIKPDDAVPVHNLANAFGKLTLSGNDVHSMARGLASGFDLLWLTWGNLVPLFAGAAISFGAKGIVQLGSDVDHTMTTIRVLSQESTESVQGLRTQLLGLSKDGIYGPIEVANAMKTMSLAGLDAKEVSASIKDVLNFAVAGTTDLKSAADVMTSVATAFGVSANAYNYVGDVITKTAAVSKSSVESIGEAFKTASVLHKQYGISLEDVGVGLAALSNLGIQGTAAGTALRNMYVDLSSRTPKVAAALKTLGLELRDQHGDFKNLVEMTKDLNAAFSNLTGKAQKDAMAVITSERGAKPLVELRDLAIKNAQEMSTGVTHELDRLAEAIANSAGFAAISAAQMAQTPLNQMKSVSNALQTSLVEAFNVISPHVLQLSAQLKDMFNSAEFKQGLETIGLLVIRVAGALATLTQFIVEHTAGVAAAVVAYAVLTKGVQYAAIAKTEEAAATVALTAAESANSAGKLAGLAGIAKWLPGIGTAVAVATGLWTAYSIATNSASDANRGFVETGSVDQLIKELDRETARIEKNTQALRENISTKELEARKLLTSTDTDAHKNLALAEAKLAVIKTEVDLKLKTYGEDTRVGKAALASLAMAQKQVDLRKEELSTEQYTLAVSMEKLKIAARTQTELQKSKTVLPVEGTGTFGGKGSGGGRSPRERSLTAATVVDNMSKIKELGNAELSVLQNQYEKERTLLEAMHDAKLDSEGTYRAKLLTLTTTSEDARIAKINETGAKELAEYERLKQAHTDATEFEIAHLKVSEDQRAEIVTQKRNALTEKLKSLDDQYKAVSATNAAAISKIEEDKYMRMQKAAYSYAGVVNKILEDTRIAEEKAARVNSQQSRLAELSQTYGMVTAATMVFQQAEKAAAEAGLSMGFQLEEALVPLNKELDRANQSLLDFVTYSIQAGVSGTKDYEDTVKGLQDRINALEAQRDSIATTGARDMALAASRAYNKVITEDVLRLKNATSDALVTALFEGGKAGATKLRAIIMGELRKPITMMINAVVNTLWGAVTGNMGTGAGGSMASSAAAGGVTGAGMAGAGSLLGSGATMAGTAYNSALVTSAYGSGAGVAASTAVAEAMGLGSTTAAGAATFGSMVATAAPYVLAAVAAYKIAKSLEGGEKRAGATYTAGSKGEALFNQGPSGGEISADTSRSLFTGTQSTINSLLASFGSTATVSGYTAGLESSKNGKGFQFAGGYVNGKGFGEYLGREGGQFTMQTQDEGTALKNYTTDLQRSVLQALDAADLGGLVGSWIDSLGDLEALTEDQVNTAMKEITVFQQLTPILKALPFEYLKNITVKATSALVAAAGGVENLGSALGTYYSLFTTDAEKLADKSKNTSEAFTQVGLSMPTTGLREWYKAQVANAGAQDLSVEANSKAYYSILKLAGSVDELDKAAEETATTRATWQEKLDVLLKKTTQEKVDLSKDLASTTDESTKAIIRQVYAQEAAIAAAEKAAEVAKAKKTWQEKLDVLLGRTTQEQIDLENDLASTTDESTKALIRQVYAQEAATASAAKYTETVLASLKAQVSAGEAVRALLASLKTGVNAGTSPQSRLDAARTQYLQDLSSARNGDFEAYNRVATTAQTYINAGAEMYASSADQKAILAQVQSELTGLPAVAKYDENLATLKRIEAAVTTGGSNTVAAIQAQQFDTLAAINSMTATLTNSFSSIDANSNGLLTFDELKAGLSVGDTLTQQLINAIDTNGDGQISKLEIIAANTYGLDTLARINATVNSINWTDKAAAVAQFSPIAQANGWSLQQIAAATGYNLVDIEALFAGSPIARGLKASGAGTSASAKAAGSAPDITAGPTDKTFYQSGSTDSLASAARQESIVTAVNNLDWNSASAATTMWNQAYWNNWSQADIASSLGYNLSDIEALFTNAGLPKFAAGGTHFGGLRLVGENGPELEATGPSRIWNASDTANMLRGGRDDQALVEEVRELRKEVARARDTVAPIHIHIIGTDGSKIKDIVIRDVKERSKRGEKIIYSSGIVT